MEKVRVKKKRHKGKHRHHSHSDHVNDAFHINKSRYQAERLIDSAGKLIAFFVGVGFVFFVLYIILQFIK